MYRVITAKKINESSLEWMKSYPEDIQEEYYDVQCLDLETLMEDIGFEERMPHNFFYEYSDKYGTCLINVQERVEFLGFRYEVVWIRDEDGNRIFENGDVIDTRVLGDIVRRLYFDFHLISNDDYVNDTYEHDPEYFLD